MNALLFDERPIIANSVQMAHTLSPKPITMAIPTTPSVNYQEWIVA
ncbi:hypothetical protein K6V48_05510 [Streptococcus suis]|nr:hypothetical protein [Streptococcus suis]MBY5010100.1 hypothetical protein [Streptococcus suis]MDG4517553.1 hypothetical protein [Streptococcus suis]